MKQEQLEQIYKVQNTPIVKFDGNQYTLNSKYKFGVISIQRNYALLKSKAQSSNKIHIEFSDLDGAHEGDEVIVKVIFHPKGRIKGRVVKVLTKQYKPVLSYYHNHKFYSIKESIPLNVQIDPSNLKDFDLCIIDHEKIINNLGSLHDPKIDETISLYMHNELHRLEPYNLSNQITKDPLEDPTRIDLTHLDFCTIDPVGAKDFDDAIYFDQASSTLFVAIADVSSYVLENSLLDQEAYKRGFSIYLPNKVLPMLPFYLSNELCSLVPHQKRAAYVFEMKLDLLGTTVEKSKVYEAVILSKNRFTYEQIDHLLETKQDSYLNELFAMTQQFRQVRLQNGYDFRNEEIRLVLDSKYNLDHQNIESSSPSHSLVEECMLLTNQEAAKKLSSIGIFRVHDAPTSAKIFDLIEDVNILGVEAQAKQNIHETILDIQKKALQVGLKKEIDELIIKAQHQAYYSHIHQSHFGLGFEYYSHFTSPIRRYADLVLHRILKTNQAPQDIEQICQNISDKEREIAKLVWDLEDRIYARWANKHVGEIFMAKLIDKQTHTVLLTDPQIQGVKVQLEKYHGEQLFSFVKVKLISSDFISKKIIGKIVY